MKAAAWLTALLAITFAGSPLVTSPFTGFRADQLPIPQVAPPLQPAGYAFSIWGVIYLWLIASCIFGALVYALVVPDGPGLIGAFPGVYGLIGGFTCLLWLRLGEIGAQQAQAFTLIGLLVGIQLVFGLLFGAGQDWVADIAGFVAGFALAFLLLPGAMLRLRDKIRRG